MPPPTAESYLSYQNLPQMFWDRAAAMGAKPFLWRRSLDGGWHSMDWAIVADQVKNLASALRGMGLQQGDRVLLVSENRPEFLIADFAIMSAGLITVPAYTTNTVDDQAYLLENSGAKAAIASKAEFAKKIHTAAVANGQSLPLIVMDATPTDIRAHGWADILQQGRANPIDIPAIIRTIRRQDVACLIYTSGTGGQPKGVMQSHGALLHNARGAFDLLAGFGLGEEVFLSFLPLSHAYEHTAGQMFPVSIGAEIYYCESADKLAQYMAEMRPTIMTAVPRLYETLYGRISGGLKRQSKFKNYLFAETLRLGRQAYEHPGSLSLPARFFNALLTVLVRRKVAARFGGRLKAMVSGGAPLNYEIGIFFQALGMHILQGYGQTETGPIVSCNTPQRNKIRTVGPPLTATEVRIATDGEILVRGELTMLGYWQNREATAAALVDGWVHTGDIGHIDADGHIVITDRKKDIICLSGGDTLSPQKIEGVLQLEPEIHQACVFGDKQAYIAALIVVAEAYDHKAVELAVERANKKLSITERVRRFSVITHPFTIENEMLTPTMKIRRHKIKAAFNERIEGMF
jgi:long-chain acyl-CoA synthetase